MNDSYVVFRLNQWAQWVSRRDDGGIGYPKSVPYINLMPRDGFSSSTPEISEECLEVEKCVMAVRAVNQELHTVLLLAYVQVNITVEQKLKRLGCCEKTYYNKIGRCNQMVLGFLNDLAAGMQLPQPEVNFVKVKKIA